MPILAVYDIKIIVQMLHKKNFCAQFSWKWDMRYVNIGCGMRNGDDEIMNNTIVAC